MPNEYVIAVVPTDIPYTIPDAEPMVATDVLLLDQIPPLTTLDKRMVAPVQTIPGPVTGPGAGLTEIVEVAMQFPANV